MSDVLAATPDTVWLEIGAQRLRGWEAVKITRSCESLPNSFEVTATLWPVDQAMSALTRPGQACRIYIGSDLLITGRIDRRVIAIGPESHTVTMVGRGMTRNLVDCSADLVNDAALKGGQINASSALAAAQRLSRAYGVTARSAVADLGPPIPWFQVLLGETPYEIIECICRYAGYLCYEDETGNLVLDRVGTTQHASGFAVPGNIEAIEATQSVDLRYSEYLVVWTGVETLADLSDLANRRANVEDAKLGDYRLKIIVSEQVAPPPVPGQAPLDSNAVARQRADWEYARRIGRSQATSITADSWRDASGALWTPNKLAPVEAPAADIVGANWIIGTVTYRKDASGTHADLVLMPPDAFRPDPNPLNLFDAALADTVPPSTAPAPAAAQH